MPVPEVSAFRGFPLIRFGGIYHLILPSVAYTDDEAESVIKVFASELDAPALGMMMCDDMGSEQSDQFSIRPLVYVPGSETLFWEHGCATGSTAIGWYRYHQDRESIATKIRQPGGVIRVDIINDQPTLTGNVVIRPAVI